MHRYIFWVLLFIGIISRFLYLDRYPISLNWDEISHGYNAYSLLKTGQDQWGISFPIFNFRAYGDFPTTLNLYLTIPFIQLLGLNNFSIRLPTAIFSLIYIYYSYLLTHLLFKSKNLALIAMSLAIFLPWSFFPGRGVFQSTFSQTLLLMGIFHFYRSFTSPRHLIYSFISFGFSMYSYHNARIIVPLIIPALFILNYSGIRKIISASSGRLVIFISSLIFLVLILPNILNLFTSSSFARNRWVGIINLNSINIIEANRNSFTGPYFINRLINNRPVYFIQSLTINYLNQFNPLPLFFHGTQNYQLAVPNHGFIYIIFLPFLYIGIYLTVINPTYQQLFYLTLICLLPAALTVGDFPVLRSSSALVFYILFIVHGISKFKKISPLFAIFVTFLFFIYYLTNYLKYQTDFAFSWQYGYQSAVEYAKSNYTNYEQIVFTKKYGEPHQFVLFYWPWNPQKFLDDPRLVYDYHADWYWVDGFDKFKFVNDWEIKDQQFSKKTLLITSPGNYPALHSTLQKTIYYPNKTPVFDIISYE